MKLKKSSSRELVKLSCQALDEKKAEDLRVLDVSEQSSITDYLVIATGSSEPHLRALRIELEKVLDKANAHIVGMEAAQESGWVVIDVFDVMIHLFLPEPRKHYALENLWKDAPEVSVAALLKAPASGKASTAKKKAPAKAKGAAKTKVDTRAKAPGEKPRATKRKPKPAAE